MKNLARMFPLFRELERLRCDLKAAQDELACSERMRDVSESVAIERLKTIEDLRRELDGTQEWLQAAEEECDLQLLRRSTLEHQARERDEAHKTAIDQYEGRLAELRYQVMTMGLDALVAQQKLEIAKSDRRQARETLRDVIGEALFTSADDEPKQDEIASLAKEVADIVTAHRNVERTLRKRISALRENSRRAARFMCVIKKWQPFLMLPEDERLLARLCQVTEDQESQTTPTLSIGHQWTVGLYESSHKEGD